MKHTSLLLLIAGLTSLTSYSQNSTYKWAATAGGAGEDAGWSVATDQEGNVITVGIFNGSADFNPGPGTNILTSNGSMDAFIQKLDAEGNFIWVKKIGGGSFDAAFSLEVDQSGNIISSGTYSETVDFDPNVGEENLTSNGNSDVFIQKLDSSGNLIWAKTFGSTSSDDLKKITLDALGNLYLTGYIGDDTDFDPGVNTSIISISGSSNKDMYILKLYSSGEYVWAKTMGGGGVTQGAAIKLDNQGNIYIGARYSGTADFDPGMGVANHTASGIPIDNVIVKLDSQGDYVWSKGITGPNNDNVFGLGIDSQGDVYSCVMFQDLVDFDPSAGVDNINSIGYQDAYLTKLDTDGNYIWTKTFGSAGDDQAYSVDFDGAGNIYLTGTYSETADFDPSSGIANFSTNGGTDIFLVIMDLNGNYIENLSIGGTGMMLLSR